MGNSTESQNSWFCSKLTNNHNRRNSKIIWMGGFCFQSYSTMSFLNTCPQTSFKCSTTALLLWGAYSIRVEGQWPMSQGTSLRHKIELYTLRACVALGHVKFAFWNQPDSLSRILHLDAVAIKIAFRNHPDSLSRILHLDDLLWHVLLLGKDWFWSFLPSFLRKYTKNVTVAF